MKLNTAFNGASAYYNRQTAHAVKAGNAAARHRDLRERGLISVRSTDLEIAEVEARLAAEMRGRLALQGAPSWDRHPRRAITTTIVFAALPMLVALAALFGPKPWLFLAIGVPTALVAWLFIAAVQRREQRIVDAVAKADWLADGTCGWCGSASAHLVEGEEEHPRVAHARELEQEVGPLYVAVAR